ncbi:triacylglycerol lipase [Thermobifida halotolerans]|uniref:Triacylglycerol lipase n=1 Tax=Thermobifida halotolerans TaxID=483545 RepID=A0A399G9S3_9ACTN|nr:triacylglycerol lipase [Thermobifida halotolerans]UOE20632.1 triacylglycerol lipase [Thermobifida halotolerans]
MRRTTAAVLGLAAALAVAVPATAHADGRDPVVFVHGYGGSGSNWDSMIEDFVDDGWDRDELYTVTYDASVSNTVIAEQVADKVDQALAETGADRADIVAHSMGSLSSRWYVRFLGGQDRVDNWISLGGPNRGSVVELPCVRTSPACAEVVVGSRFLQILNGGDPTPGNVTYTTLRSPCDLVVLPHSSVTLEGADNRLTLCVSHTSMVTSPTVSASVRNVLS